MKTSKPISTICYLDADALLTRLQRIEAEHPDAFSNWAFVIHKAEKTGQKDHIHLMLVPAGVFDTNTLWFKEAFYTLHNSEVVSSVKPWTNSKETDWTLYTMHNSQYLAKKGLARKYHYFESAFFSNDPDWFADLCDMSLASQRTCVERMENCFKQGLNVFQAMSVCGVSYGAMRSFSETYTNMKTYFESLKEENSNEN